MINDEEQQKNNNHIIDVEKQILEDLFEGNINLNKNSEKTEIIKSLKVSSLLILLT